MLLASVFMNPAIDERSEWSPLALFEVSSVLNTACIHIVKMGAFQFRPSMHNGYL